MTPETKHHLIVGGALIVAVIVGIVVYKKYEAQSGDAQAAQQQSDDDALAYLEATSFSNPYDLSGEGGGGGSISLPSAAPTQSLADEINSIEQALGFSAPTSSSSSPSSSGSSPSAPSSTASALPATTRVPTPYTGPAPVTPRSLLGDEPPSLQLEHEEFVA